MLDLLAAGVPESKVLASHGLTVDDIRAGLAFGSELIPDIRVYSEMDAEPSLRV